MRSPRPVKMYSDFRCSGCRDCPMMLMVRIRFCFTTVSFSTKQLEMKGTQCISNTANAGQLAECIPSLWQNGD